MRSSDRYQKKTTLTLIIVSLVVAITVLSGCRSSDPGTGTDTTPGTTGFDKETLLRIGPVDYTLTEVEWTFMQTYRPDQDMSDTEKLFDAVVRQLEKETYIFLEAEKTESFDKEEVRLKEEVILPQYIGQYHFQNGRPGEPYTTTDEEMASMEPETWEKIRISQVVVVSQEEAMKVKTLLDGGEDFASVARQYSFGPNSMSGGQVSERFVRGTAAVYSPEVHEKLFDYQESEITEPIQTGMGWTVFRIDERYPILQAEIQSRKNALRSNIATRKKFTLRGEIEKTYNFIVFKDALKVAFPDPARLGDVVVGQVEDIKVKMDHLRFYTSWLNIDLPDDYKGWEKILRQMGSGLLFYTDAVNTGGDKVSDLVYSLNFFRRKILSSAYLKALVGKIPVTDEELWNQYRSDQLVSSNPGKKKEGYYGMRVLHVVSEDKVRSAIKEFVEGRSWNEVYASYSNDKRSAEGGAPISVIVSMMPWKIYDSVRELAEGDLSKPLQMSDDVWTVFLVEKKQVGREEEFHEARESLLFSLQKIRKEELMFESLTRGKARYTLKIPGRSVLMEKIPEWVELLAAEKAGVPGPGDPPHNFSPH